MIFLELAFIGLWLYLLFLLSKLELHFFKFVLGVAGLFLFVIVLGKNQPERYVTYLTAYPLEWFGHLTHLFTLDLRKLSISQVHDGKVITFVINHDISGFVEMLGYFCILMFYPLYAPIEKTKQLLFGVFYLVLVNCLRIVFVSLSARIFGDSVLLMTNLVIGRFLYFSLIIILYYLVFTKPHILRQKVGAIDG